MAFGIGEILGGVSTISGLMGAGKSKTMQQQPIYDPRANELLDILSGKGKELMDKPYQSPMLLRYNPTSQFQQSSILDQIQQAIDASQMASPAQEAAPAQPQVTGKDAADAQKARALQAAMEADSYGLLSNRRGGKQMFMAGMPQNGSDTDIANFYRFYMNEGGARTPGTQGFTDYMNYVNRAVGV